ncbi:hypothetical protein [Flavobacterium johnsoniae]|jgi:hypothetical protein|uniref:Uncharacterized protein n=3 Tax=Flavobacterium johnsoniae TaxID=986 RepID=A0A1M6WYY6_FLAJO|nr:hypothetical protein [Flavobacterium johnsoniae]ABQ07888.1 hypothetical protein Fjoh_4889 [Flavobacterium johnsoniae UW101]OXG01970.1 hypothetical protein B0A63_04740 [Flavobacterium johnsoniae UW101]WQG80268.1 hypothetical protein SR927_19875 [Flavobacterium johnsoniae UW101]SHG38032.1 hypothetical protein SAMN05444388_102462 [Flavobacterium johnsoniae]SHK98775.1 hypothetical protein SAMN05444146_2574 [Flavobacterium johnsoniae]
MKTKLRIVFFALITSFFIHAQQQPKGIIGTTNWMNNWTNFKPAINEYNEATNIIAGTIDKDTRLVKRNTYHLVGVVYVTNNATLTIEPGTVIRGDDKTCGTLVITNGAKIMAEGLETDPIVFTSENEKNNRKPGDWGGIIILGKAPINTLGGIHTLPFDLEPTLNHYGGQDPEDNSGVMKYVRIEYAGRKLSASKELNGLSLAGVGRKTVLSNIQISFSNDDSFECYGGDLNMSNLISYRTTDDDFDFTQGAQINITNSIAVRHPFSSDISGSRCFEVDSYDKVQNTDMSKKMTKINASNITLINLEENNQGLVRESIYVRENTFFNLNNSIVSGFSPFVLLEGNIGNGNENLAKMSFKNTIVNNCNGGITSESSSSDASIQNFYNPNSGLEYTKMKNIELFITPNIKGNPDFRANVNNTLAIGN